MSPITHALRKATVAAPLARPATATATTTARQIHRTAPLLKALDNKATSSWPEGSSSRPHTEYKPVEGREGKTARLIFRIKPSDIPMELLPLFAAVGFAVVGASAYGVYALWNDKTLRVHRHGERK
ncbi:hypothetical protein J056_003282 [Wallemia ichthyophaga EXF-994]|uniref:Uncharacterized protein n=1 Tax=Wallemia ichthyophaga (strain EXF-994 / CBS 113033) TaxID=1299270 RepID=R9AKV8_WALI9|nr:uncharacterized protein J056_003282 [Wallemia ichthyophaga EXF-994]EOR02720.1 hypothetical protein J056_003282 [Wallemia ichthyophaga EXF-994]TIA72879.1 hypothetical protein E3P91_01732 [Wallemia ichthyophaga]